MEEVLSRIDIEIGNLQNECREFQQKVDYLNAKIDGLRRAQDFVQAAYDKIPKPGRNA